MAEDLEDALVVHSRRRLQGPVAPVAEGPRPAHAEPRRGGAAEHLRYLPPLARLRRDVHHPVGVEAIKQEGGAVEDELGAAGPHKPTAAALLSPGLARESQQDEDAAEAEGSAGVGHGSAEG